VGSTRDKFGEQLKAREREIQDLHLQVLYIDASHYVYESHSYTR
jgi:hypothetical protein